MSATIEQGTMIAPVAIGNTTPLLAVDRCDAGDCAAQAYVRVNLPGDFELLFCGHDYAKREASLATVALHVHDQRADLLPKPFDPATDNS